MANDYENLVARWRRQAGYHQAAAADPHTSETNVAVFKEVADVLRRVADELEVAIRESADA
jgi:hypothetical protein